MAGQFVTQDDCDVDGRCRYCRQSVGHLHHMGYAHKVGTTPAVTMQVDKAWLEEMLTLIPRHPDGRAREGWVGRISGPDIDAIITELLELRSECAAISAKSALTRSDPAVRDRVTDEMVEAAARVLVPVWYGGFEDQRQKGDGTGWLNPPGTPNGRARTTARAALTAALRTSPPEPASGWVMVPVVSTASMNQAYLNEKYNGEKPTLIPNLWKAMLSAVPAPPAKEPQ